MTIRYLLSALLGAGVAMGAASAAEAEPTNHELVTAAPDARLGIVRVRIDPDVGEQDAAIRDLLASHPFVRIAEPADYLIATRADFPLDIMLVDLREPFALWDAYDSDFQSKIPEPRQFAIGNLMDERTEDRLSRVLVGAARLRTILDRSLDDQQGVEACLQMTRGNSVACQPIDGPKAPRLVDLENLPVLKVTKSSCRGSVCRHSRRERKPGARAPVADGDSSPSRKVGPGQTVDLQPMLAAQNYADDPRFLLLVSGRQFSVDALSQPAPLETRGELRCGKRGCGLPHAITFNSPE